MRLKKPVMTPFILGLLFFALSIVFVEDGVKRQQEYQIIKDSLISIPATVSYISVLEDSDGQDTYTACVSYIYDGTSYRDKGWKGMSKGEYGIGQQVEIYINPDKPNMPYTYPRNILGHIGACVGFLAISGGFIFLSFRLKKTNKVVNEEK